ncbi:MAG: hypothetical protein RBU21_17195 [FCB group bacterium]|jgi:hypothetical protein|nr:hypothetical protein [FCB group bacterium]
MSETVRTIGGISKGGRRGGGRGRLRAFVLLILLLGIGYAVWTTRDTHPLPRLIPGDQKYWVVVNDIAEKRQKLVQSDVLDSLSHWTDTTALKATLEQEIPLPSWVINNLMGETCYFSGNDLKEFKDVLVVSRMSRVGALLERLHVFSGSVEDDPAGGLNLRKISGQSLYYAARGRALVLSPDRNVLIRSLTLRPDECAKGKALARALEQSGSEDLQGSISFAPDDPLGAQVQAMGFALRVDDAQAKLKCRATLRPDVESRFGDLLRNVTPQTLDTPVDGLMMVSADFGKPVREVWVGLGQAFGLPALSAEQWDAWKAAPEDAPPGFANVLTSVLEDAGPGICLTWYDTDLNEIFPAPEIVGTFDRGTAPIDAIFASLPAALESSAGSAGLPQYDAKRKRLVLPIIGGPSLNPTFASYGGTLFVSTSSAAADEVLARKPGEATLPAPGNFYFRMRPLPCVQAVAGAGELLVEMDALKGFTRETFDREVQKWTEKAKAVDDISALLSVDNGEVLGELTVTTRMSETEPGKRETDPGLNQ